MLTERSRNQEIELKDLHDQLCTDVWPCRITKKVEGMHGCLTY